MSFLSEFKTFAMRGNVIDMAVGIIIGAAFGKVINSLVADILMPPLGLLIGGMDFSYLAIPLKEATTTHPGVLIKYGLFINSLVDFTIMAFAIFLGIKAINRLKKPEPVLKVTKNCPECCLDIPIEAKKCGHCCSLIEKNDFSQNKKIIEKE